MKKTHKGHNRSVWWLSSSKMTIGVTVDEEEKIVEMATIVRKEEIIVDAAPIVRKFVGQPLRNLIGWMEKQGGFRKQRLSC